MSSVELFSSSLCPFAHRVRLVLAEKQIEAKTIEVDLRNKPPEFLAIAPHGQVPLLRHGGRLVWESAVINEYLEESFPDSPLLPEDAGDRATARIWIQFADSRLYAHTRALIYAREPVAQRQAAQEVTRDLQFMEQALAGTSGPYWLGGRFSIVDATFYPWFEQLPVLKVCRGLEWPPDCDRLLSWCDAVARRDSVRSQSNTGDFYVDRYRPLLC
jgi:glutathione S-transferase